MGGRKGFLRKGFVKRKIEETGKGKPNREERREKKRGRGISLFHQPKNSAAKLLKVLKEIF